MHDRQENIQDINDDIQLLNNHLHYVLNGISVIRRKLEDYDLSPDDVVINKEQITAANKAIEAYLKLISG